MAKRGRPRKEDVTPSVQHQARVKQLDEAQEIAKWYKTVDEWYVIQNNKVVKCVKKANGNVNRMYVCKVNKESKTFVDKIKQDGKVRVA